MKGGETVSYSSLIKSAIESSGLTLRRISNKFDDYGINIDPSYLSRLQTGDANPATDKVNKVIATVLGINELELRIAAYIAKIPIELQDYISIKTEVQE